MDDRDMASDGLSSLRDQAASSVLPVPDSIPDADLLTMSCEQYLVLDRMSDDLGYPFRDIASDCGIPEREVRRIIRHFHIMGMTGFGPLYSEDAPCLRGKGYWLSRHGLGLQREMRRMFTWQELWEMREAAQAIDAKRAQGVPEEAKKEAP